MTDSPTRPVLKRKLTPKPKAAQPEAPEARALPTVTGPLIVRTPGLGKGPDRIVVTPSGLTMLEALAADGAPTSLGASTLGIGKTLFSKMLNCEEDDLHAPVMLAWQRGVATLEHEVSRHLLTAMRKGNVIAAIFFSKARLGWTEQPQITNQVGISITLPQSLSSEEFALKIAERQQLTAPQGARGLVRKINEESGL